MGPERAGGAHGARRSEKVQSSANTSLSLTPAQRVDRNDTFQRPTEGASFRSIFCSCDVRAAAAVLVRIDVKVVWTKSVRATEREIDLI